MTNMGRYEMDIFENNASFIYSNYVEGKRIFNTEVAKIHFNTRTSDLGGLRIWCGRGGRT
jgi:hypothetical protein